MEFRKVKEPEINKGIPGTTTFIYNPKITIRHIPLEAYDYIEPVPKAEDFNFDASLFGAGY